MWRFPRLKTRNVTVPLSDSEFGVLSHGLTDGYALESMIQTEGPTVPAREMKSEVPHADGQGRCPHCLATVRFEGLRQPKYATPQGDLVFEAGEKDQTLMTLRFARCPSCLKPIITTTHGSIDRWVSRVLWPQTTSRAPVPKQVPSEIASDYSEAAAILQLSPKASAALSRRCLQNLLQKAAGTKEGNLSDQIDEVLPALPPYIARYLDALRNIGNFAAHPIKSKTTNAVMDVEPGEAEWNLDVLDALFDYFYYVTPAKSEERRKGLGEKLKEVTKRSIERSYLAQRLMDPSIERTINRIDLVQ